MSHDHFQESSNDTEVNSRSGMRREQCASCGMPVFLAEKLVISKMPYHRTCFRCARCRTQLTPGNYYETEEGQYCCETCPDEESIVISRQQQEQQMSGIDLEDESDEFGDNPDERPISDEEKTKRRTLELQAKPTLQQLTSPEAPQTQCPRLNFMESVMDSGGGELVDNPDEMSNKSDSEKSSASPDSSRREPVNSPLELEKRSIYDNQHRTAILPHDVACKGALRVNEDTKDTPDEPVDGVRPAVTSLVRRRLQMFEQPEMDTTGKDDAALTRRSNECVAPAFTEDRKKIDEDSSFYGSPRTEDDADSKVVFETDGTSRTLGGSVVLLDEVKPLDSPVGESILTEHPVDKVESDLCAIRDIDLSGKKEYPDDLNPFNTDEDEPQEQPVVEDTRSGRKVSTNPFGSSDEEEAASQVTSTPPKPATRSNIAKDDIPTKRILEAPRINLNPFWSDEEEPDSDTDSKNKSVPASVPVPKPRTLKVSSSSGGGLPRKSDMDSSGIYTSNSSLASSGSATPSGTYRKKKPAPPPPILNQVTPSKIPLTPPPIKHAVTPIPNASPRLTPRARKSKHAPPPPTTSTPQKISATPEPPLIAESPIVPTEISYREDLQSSADTRAEVEFCEELKSPVARTEVEVCEELKSPVARTEVEFNEEQMWEEEKSCKDETNRNRQSMSCSDSPNFVGYPDKSMQGKWKRKKGPAPPRPIPHRRRIKVMSLKDVKLELDQIEMQQQGLEKQGVRLEQIIREKCETGPASEDASLGLDAEELVLELFALVNEKNELFRRQAELMLLRRQQRLEEEHADIEYQIRCLMTQPEATKTDFDKQREEKLIQKLVEIVERRNEIIECLEMDRRREVEEDRSINIHMGLYAARSKGDLQNTTDESRSSMKKKGKMKEKTKEKKSKRLNKKDADKDEDETETKIKRHGKKKWF